MNDDDKILDQNSRSVQTWNNIPRFHQDIINGKSFQKKKKQEKLDRCLKKKQQRGMDNFLETDPYNSKTVVIESSREVLD